MSRSVSANLPNAETNGKSVAFLHGFNTTEEQARRWNFEVFKRLRQSGSNARFHAVTWRDDIGVWNQKSLFYHEDIKDVAFPYIHKIWNDITTKGVLR